MLSSTAPARATKEYRQYSDNEAIEYQVEFLYHRRPVVIEGRGAISLFWEVLRESATRAFIRKCLQRLPRDHYEVLYREERERIKYVPSTRPGYLGRFTRIKYLDDYEHLPLTYNWEDAEVYGGDARDYLVMPPGMVHGEDTGGQDCERDRSKPLPTLEEVKRAHPGVLGGKDYAPCPDGFRGRVIYRIAKKLADDDATADEIEAAVRASPAFKSKAGSFSQGGQGARWGEQEIRRMRRRAR